MCNLRFSFRPRKRNCWRALLVLLISFLGATAVRGQKPRHVPGDAATIQARINAASDGDAVLVAPGTYTERIDFRGKNITLTSSGGAATTIIDGNSDGIVVTFSGGETRKAVINGFTIQNGALGPDSTDIYDCDGIYVSTANPTITNNIITNNRGYGIEVGNGNPLISGNTISNTTTRRPPDRDWGCDYEDGVGIRLGGNPNATDAFCD